MNTRPEESYWQWCVLVCDLHNSWMKRPWPALVRNAPPPPPPKKEYRHLPLFCFKQFIRNVWNFIKVIPSGMWKSRENRTKVPQLTCFGKFFPACLFWSELIRRVIWSWKVTHLRERRNGHSVFSKAVKKTLDTGMHNADNFVTRSKINRFSEKSVEWRHKLLLKFLKLAPTYFRPMNGPTDTFHYRVFSSVT